MFIKIENRHGNGVNIEVIECDRYETKNDGEVLVISMYSGEIGKEKVTERSLGFSKDGEGVGKKDNKEVKGEFGKSLVVYIMNNKGATIDKIIM